MSRCMKASECLSAEILRQGIEAVSNILIAAASKNNNIVSGNTAEYYTQNTTESLNIMLKVGNFIFNHYAAGG